MDQPCDMSAYAVELRKEVEALRLRVAQLEANCDAAQASLRLRQASALAGLGTWEWDASTDRVTWSGDMFRIYGIRPDEFTGKGSDYIQATRADYRELQKRNLETAWKNGVTEEALRAGAGPIGDFKELCIVRPDGTECYTLGDAVCIVDADGKPLRMLGITVDISESKRAEQALRQSEERLRLASEAGGFGTYSYDFNTGLGHWSPELRAHWGLGLDDPVKLDSDGLVPFLHPEDRAGFLAAMTSANEPSSDGIFEFEYRVIWPDSSVHWLRALGRTDFTGEGENRRAWRANGATVDITERKLAAQALQGAVKVLRESESKWKALYSTLPVGVSILDDQGNLVEFNPMLGKILGIDTEALRQGRYRQLIYLRADGTPMLSEEFPSVLAVKEQCTVRNVEIGVRKEDDQVVWTRVSAAPLNLPGLSCIISTTDITERKKAEALLTESEKRLHEAQALAHIGVWDWNAETDTVVWTAELYRIAGLDPGSPAPTYQDHSTLYVAESWQLLKSGVEKAMKTGEPYQFELELIRPDGSTRVVNAYGGAKYDTQGRVNGLLGTVQDITERKRAATAIVESEQKFAKAFRSSPGAVSLTALDDGRYLDVNEEFLRTTGFARDEVIGRTTADLNVWPTQEARQHFIEALAATGRLMGLECAFRMRSGEIRQCQISSEVIELNGTKCCLNFMLDFTDRKRAEAEKAKLESQLLQAEKMESVGRLAGGVAHDFNNMLGVILGHVEMAMEDMAPAEAPLRDNLEEIRKAAERSANLTRQLLAFARKQTVAPKVLDLNETVASMFKMLRRLVGEDINLVWLPGAKLYQVKVDPSQIDQILANLCVNARDAIGGVGKLTIETANSTFDDNYCATHAEVVPGEYVKLTVTDDGCGMDKATQERIFEPFFTTKGVGKGTGLGLATIYGIVKQNNGFINVTTEPDKGTTFEICLPRHVTAKTGPAQEEPLSVPVARGRETILVVEDEPSILDMTKTMLERLGYTVLIASSAREAIRLAGAYTGVIHLLITDVVMPEMNGRALAKNLLTSYPALKRLFMSGHTADVIARHGVLEEGVHFIQKPFSKKDLAAIVRKVLERG